ncbi:hypothetical protein HCH_05759 [Hahella chejuensis KCTC 2396]|uniref:Uncharacterized protein n=1 Tax=Hahella chejuensis (strain KCTC 2396) TaxID=349521 RepID=Q2SAB4_HAHCH|nr:hypothetical protein [Hahella chejuensis]ABC32410.1 hypothetical protein HCH_05759 [Hahella chejuensis KCTC 2396]
MQTATPAPPSPGMRKLNLAGWTATSFLRLMAALLTLLGLAACAHQPTPSKPGLTTPGVHPITPTQEQFWWRACFRMPFNDNGDPNWNMDLLLADQVVAPVLAQHAGALPLWRFHRRAAPDAAGHQFSLLFYTDPNTAGRVFKGLESSPIVAQLLQSGDLNQLVVKCGYRDPTSDLQATSDPNWEPHLQKTWPYFIMGVSAHWLALIQSFGEDIPTQSDDTASLLERYGQIRQKVSGVWQGQGQHAYLHHLSALFGYEPMLIQKFIQF